MEYAEFEGLVGKLEQEARDHPGRYRAKVLGLSLLGYGYVFAVLGVVLVLGAALVLMVASGNGVALFLKFGWILAIFAWSVGAALWVKLEPPSGPVIRRKDAPELFARIEAIRKRLRAPRPHVVLAQNDVNAAIVQHPRLGIFGWPRNYLMLGLPLMRSLSSAEFEGVLAHEFGHLAGSHGRFGNWIYRQRSFWSRILPKLEEKQSYGATVFRRFLEWFSPYFQAYTFVLGRSQEYEADRAGAEGGSTRTMADALARVKIAAHRVGEEFWPGIETSMRTTAQAPTRLFVDLGRRLEDPGEVAADAMSDAEIIERWMQVETTLDDTHPALKDRLAALGEEPRVPPPSERSAAEELLGDLAERLELEFSEEWRSWVTPRWIEGYRAAQEARARIAELQTQAELSVEHTWELACLLSDEGRTEEAYALVGQVVERDPDFARARRTWGIHLLEQGDDSGLGHLERSVELSNENVIESCRAAYAFLKPAGREQEARAWVDRARAFEERAEAAAAERATYDQSDPVEPHGVPDGNLEGLREQLAEDKRIKCAWIVRKTLQIEPEESPAFVMLLRVGGGWHRSNRESLKLAGEYANTLSVSENWFCMLEDAASRRMKRSIKATAGEPFYVRGRERAAAA